VWRGGLSPEQKNGWGGGIEHLSRGPTYKRKGVGSNGGKTGKNAWEGTEPAIGGGENHLGPWDKKVVPSGRPSGPIEPTERDIGKSTQPG